MKQVKLLLKYGNPAPGTFWERVNSRYTILLDKLRKKYGNDLIITTATINDNMFNFPLHDIYYNLWAMDRLFVIKNKDKVKFLCSGSGSSHPKNTMRVLNSEIELFNKHPEKFVNADPNVWGKKVTIKKILDEIILYDNVDYIYVPGEFIKQTYIDYGIPEEKLIVLTYSVDPERFKRVRPRADKFTIFFAGGDKLRKAERFVLEALSKLNFEFDYINWHNASMYDRIYNASHVALLPTFEDGLPVTLLECMSHEIPFIASYNMSFSEFFDIEDINSMFRVAYRKGTDELCGVFVDANDKKHLSDNIEEALTFFYENVNLISNWGNNCRQVILEQITWGKWEDKLFQFFIDRIEECK